MKFTSEDLMKAMGLQVGDRVEIILAVNHELFIIEKDINGCIILHEINCDYIEDLGYLLDLNYEILPRVKTVGDLKCDIKKGCMHCPVRSICQEIQQLNNITSKTRSNCSFYELLELYKNEVSANIFDQEIYDLLKARLDKEVE